MSEGKLFLHAVQLLTRLPTPRSLDCGPGATSRAAKYFPLVGQIVGLIAAGMLFVASHFWGGALPALLAIGVGVLITGALHEDGLADTADGLGGGSDRERRLAIMKDSRTGTYGVVALVICIAVKVFALSNMRPAEAAFALIAAHGGGRCASVAAMALLPYGGDPTSAKLTSPATRVPTTGLLIATACALWPLILLTAHAALAGVLLGSAAAAWIALMARNLIGGFTGDILGAIEQLFEAGFLLGAAAAVVTR